MTKREVEYIALSRDTTESDLKQRREISSGTAYYVDQCAVRAATRGRVLILEGIEKAERNVLPVLNNLLENRWLHLCVCCYLSSKMFAFKYLFWTTIFNDNWFPLPVDVDVDCSQIHIALTQTFLRLIYHFVSWSIQD